MRSMLCCFVLVIACGTVGAQDPKKKMTPESLAQKYAKESVQTLTEFPYPDMEEGKKFAQSVADLLNSAEEFFRDSEKSRKNGETAALAGHTIVGFDLNLLSLRMSIEKLQWTLKDIKPPEAKYTIAWSGEKWVVKASPPPASQSR